MASIQAKKFMWLIPGPSCLQPDSAGPEHRFPAGAPAVRQLAEFPDSVSAGWRRVDTVPAPVRARLLRFPFPEQSLRVRQWRIRRILAQLGPWP
ncbi:hypothetical protein ebA4441 [Aromatoleum aromaticum EbN1]|uniref:Uncharacterized protein n=1 Tax=Aromatoleum aromaticum (strain DSM 19018 / LMG 30748 / EbN1) TaxID=76114 RepID=Q5P226_AROAE|nr:hypothetical protein ebA4441 [Aromatoleum aromaticum EbN1]